MKNFLFLILTITLMLFVSYNSSAEEEGWFQPRTPAAGPDKGLLEQMENSGTGSLYPKNDPKIQEGDTHTKEKIEYCPLCDPNMNLNTSVIQGSPTSGPTTTPAEGNGTK